MVKKYKYRHKEIYKDMPIDVKANTTAELLRKIESKKADIDRGFIDTSTRFEAFALKYLETYKQHTVSKDWYDNISSIVKTKIIPGIGNKPIEKIKPINVQDFLNSCTGHSDEYVGKIYQLTCQIFKSAYKNRLTDEDFTIHFERPKGKSSQKGRSLTDYERKILLDVLDGRITEDFHRKDFKVPAHPTPHRAELLCKLTLYCNLRPGEARALLWKDIDFTNSSVEVNKSMKKDGTVGPPKSKTSHRLIPVPDYFLGRLLDIKRQRNAFPFDHVCLNGTVPFNSETTKNAWNNIKRLMNIGMGCHVERNQLIPPYPLDDRFIMYYLRHTCCTDYEKAGIPINIASRFMGHSSIEITSKIYTHASDETFSMAKKLLNKQAEFYKNAMQG